MTFASENDGNRLVLSYLGIRRAIGMSGLLLPVVLGPLGWLVLGIEIQDNISSYYHTPLRNVFVGTLCAMAVFLFCYRGYGWIENWTANVGCAAALGVALCPLDYGSDPLYQRSIVGYIHSFSGGTFFLTLAVYSLYHFPSRDHSRPEMASHIAERNFIYYTSGVVILLSMVAMGTYLLLIPADWKRSLNEFNYLFWMEWIALWAFAAAWLAKSHMIVTEIGIDLLAYSRRFVER
ncbi:hypothetical protein [Rhodopirellula sp. MGV]|uniref:hypothetical protein n=1 Tax=Rhodopirellula sp. MGV TaxID=2023130 RepID=UPI000B96E885|nr:hypothetical protein [Rhodopirellula sp. MGV]OYP38234.1 hypothetical protein CGZ80_03175 [Rhodopirellula sp. MGV]PNY38570.1 hypothetical protein C2E31_01225 [Rhodopirellula baltica]